MIMAKYEGICHICEEPYADAIDHVVPVAKGGSDHPDNLRPAHTSCNSKKGAKSYPKWAENNPAMWIRGHEPKAVKAKEEQRLAERRAQAAREEAARQQLLGRAREAARENNWDFEQLRKQVDYDGQARGIEDIQIEFLSIDGWKRGMERPHTPKGTALSGIGRMTLIPEGRQRVLAHEIFEKYPDVICMYDRIEIAVAVSGYCSACKCFVLHTRREGWKHDCFPRWRKHKRPRFAIKS